VDPLSQFALWAQLFIEQWGYLGVFIVSLIGNSSIILPVPSFLAVFAAGSLLNPWLVGLIAGIGAALGELTGYILGMGGRKALEARYKRDIGRLKKVMEKYGMFPLLVLFAATPLPDDLVGILAGIIRYNVKKFLLATLIGKVIMHVGLAWAGFFGSWLLGGWSGVFSFVIALTIVIVLYHVYKAAVDWRKGKLKKL
jgi:membrane protein YqaA with SNARE-associated domain